MRAEMHAKMHAKTRPEKHAEIQGKLIPQDLRRISPGILQLIRRISRRIWEGVRINTTARAPKAKRLRG